MSEQKQYEPLPNAAQIERRFMESVFKEVERARGKFPWWPTDIVHATVVVAEEAGELLKAANEIKWQHKRATINNLHEELIQTVAMCVRLYVETVLPYDE